MHKKFFSLFLILTVMTLLFSNSTVSNAYDLAESENYEYYLPYIVNGQDYWAYKECLKKGLTQEAQKYYKDWFALYEEERKFLIDDEGDTLWPMSCSSGYYMIIPRNSICAQRIINGEVGDKSRLGQLDMSNNVFYPGLGVPNSVLEPTINNNTETIINDISEIKQDSNNTIETIPEESQTFVEEEINPNIINGNGYTITLKPRGVVISFTSKNNYNIKVEGIDYSYYKLYSISGTSKNISGLVSGYKYKITIGTNVSYTGTIWENPITITVK